jgi:hypothetical protein
MLYAAKIAAAQLNAPKHELEAMLAALRAEERAALKALEEREHLKARDRRLRRLDWTFAASGVAPARKSRDPDRPLSPRLRHRRRDRQHG